MGKSLNDKLNELPEARREHIHAMANSLVAEFSDQVPVSLEDSDDTQPPPHKRIEGPA